MYSKNDYRYYLENQLMHSDDFLAHYGVKGMKWRKKKGSDIISRGINNGANETISPGTSRIARDIGIGSTIAKGVYRKADGDAAIQYANRRFYSSGKKRSLKKKVSDYRKKHNIKSSVFNKNVWKREVPKGKKLKGSKNIYVSHE